MGFNASNEEAQCVRSGEHGLNIQSFLNGPLKGKRDELIYEEPWQIDVGSGFGEWHEWRGTGSWRGR